MSGGISHRHVCLTSVSTERFVRLWVSILHNRHIRTGSGEQPKTRYAAPKSPGGFQQIVRCRCLDPSSVAGTTFKIIHRLDRVSLDREQKWTPKVLKSPSFFSLDSLLSRVEENCGQRLAVHDRALVDHLQDFRELNQAKINVLVLFRMSVSGHKSLGNKDFH